MMSRIVASYASDLTVREARQRYFDANGFGSGGYEDKWVKLKAGPFRFSIPNTASRVRSVRLHDLHHVATEYDTTWTGEAEIAAWELGSGCHNHWAAWVLNIGAAGIGMLIAPRLVTRAFHRGLHTRNLYRGEFDERFLAMTVGELRRELELVTD